MMLQLPIIISAFAPGRRTIIAADHAQHLSPLCKQIRDHYHLKRSSNSGKYYPHFLL